MQPKISKAEELARVIDAVSTLYYNELLSDKEYDSINKKLRTKYKKQFLNLANNIE